MSNRFLFCKTGGGQFILLLLLILWGQSIFAQTDSTINCGQLSAYVVAHAFTGSDDGSSCIPCCGGTLACDKVVYDVYLRVNDLAFGDVDLPNYGDFDVAFSELYLSMKLTRGTGSLLSTIDTISSYYCLYPGISDDDFKIMEDIATLFISDNALGNATSITFNDPDNNSQCVAISKFPIFSIAVDAVAGESLGVACNDFTYVSAETCINATCSGVSNAVFPMPTSSNTQFTLTLDDMNCDPEEYIELPILVTSTLMDHIGSFDFIVLIGTTASDGFYKKPEYTSSLGNTSTGDPIYLPATQQYSVHIKSPGQSWGTFFGTDLLLGTIKIYRPPLLDQSYTISAALIPERVRVDGGTNSGCRAISTGASTSEMCEHEPPNDCTDNYDITVTNEATLQNCSTLVSYITLSWDPAAFGNHNSLPFTYLRTILDFKLESGLTITNASLDGMSCPSGTCLQFSDNVVDLNINVLSPITVNNNARIEVTFTGSSGCIKDVLVRTMVLSRTVGNACLPNIIVDPSPFTACIPVDNMIQGEIATELGCWVEPVDMVITSTSAPTTCNRSFSTGGTNGNFCAPYTSSCLCDLTTAGVYTVTPEKDDNPLNGVTTYDLVLISKHSLGIEHLNSPYKMIAADINKSGTITSFDIVEERKLILGIYTAYPNNNSWRFVDKSFVFPDTLNPFQTAFPEEYTLSSFPDSEVDFVGIKIGDVNNTVITDCPVCDAFQRPEGMYPLNLSKKGTLRAGDVYTLPIRAGGEVPLIAWQSAFRFDPAYLELIGPSLGDVPGISADNFNLNQAHEGLIRALWYAEPDAWEENAIQPGQSLFNLTFRVKTDLPENESPIRLDEVVMPNQAWTKEGNTLALQTAVSSSREEETEASEMPLWVRCRPNPSMGAVTFDIVALPQTRRAQLNVFDAFGRRVWHRDLGSETGPLQLVVPEAAAWPVGVYQWELRMDQQKSSGMFVRQ